MGSDVGQIFLTASLHRDYSILYALVFEKEFSSWAKVGEKKFYPRVKSHIPLSGVQELIVSPRMKRPSQATLNHATWQPYLFSFIKH